MGTPAVAQPLRNTRVVVGTTVNVGGLRVLVACALLGTASVAGVASAEPRQTAALIYDGFGTPDGAVISGRAVRNAAGFEPVSTSEGKLKKLGRSLRSFRPKPMSATQVTVQVGDRSFTATTDKKGFFELNLSKEQLQGLGVNEHPVEAHVVGQKASPPWAGGVLHLWPRNGTVVVSDIDDTAINTGVHQKARMVARTFVQNAGDVQPVAAAARFYSTMKKNGVPTIFISSSPTNLYSRLTQALSLRKFPRSPMLLKQVALSGVNSINSHADYKLNHLDKVQRLLPGYRFVLLGDPRDSDQEVYKRFASKVGAKRVLFTGIRDLRTDPTAKGLRGQAFFKSFAELGMMLRSRGLREAARTSNRLQTFSRPQTSSRRPARAPVRPPRTTARFRAR